MSDDFHMWHAGRLTAEQCEDCTFFNGQVRELSYLTACSRHHRLRSAGGMEGRPL
jgi:hypothetical protein